MLQYSWACNVKIYRCVLFFTSKKTSAQVCQGSGMKPSVEMRGWGCTLDSMVLQNLECSDLFLSSIVGYNGRCCLPFSLLASQLYLTWRFLLQLKGGWLYPHTNSIKPNWGMWVLWQQMEQVLPVSNNDLHSPSKCSLWTLHLSTEASNILSNSPRENELVEVECGVIERDFLNI